jgi:hypothetical protein
MYGTLPYQHLLQLSSFHQLEHTENLIMVLWISLPEGGEGQFSLTYMVNCVA